MERAISATDANRRFSRLLQGVRRGHTYAIKYHGKPLPVTTVERWTRQELYEDDRSQMIGFPFSSALAQTN
jgi:hypothetical protein